MSRIAPDVGYLTSLVGREARTVPDRIVAEVTRNWPSDGNPELLSTQFERVIGVNKARGYDLESWRLSQLHIPRHNGCGPGVCETIIAVFVKV